MFALALSLLVRLAGAKSRGEPFTLARNLRWRLNGRAKSKTGFLPRLDSATGAKYRLRGQSFTGGDYDEERGSERCAEEGRVSPIAAAPGR